MDGGLREAGMLLVMGTLLLAGAMVFLLVIGALVWTSRKLVVLLHAHPKVPRWLLWMGVAVGLLWLVGVVLFMGMMFWDIGAVLFARLSRL